MKVLAITMAAVVAAISASVAQAPARKLARELTAANVSATLTVSTPAFNAGESIPAPYGAEGDGLSPALTWRGAPAATRSFVMMMEDPDAASPKPFVHWTIYNVPPGVTALHESMPAIPQLPDLSMARQGRNSRGTIGYTGPRPPKGDPPHHYHFQVFALDVMTDLPPSASPETIIAAMNGHVIASGELIGLFQR